VIQDFDTALAIVLGFEGGFASDAKDKGGPTCLGITQAVYSAWLKNHNLPDAPVAGITHEYASAIYLETYWNGVCDALPSPLNAVAFDGAVNHGRTGVRGLLVSALAFPGASVESEAFALLVLRDRLYRQIVLRDPSQERFLHGWLNRLANLRKAVGL
jgi:lysozyme family protein